MASSFSVVTRTRLPVAKLFDVSLSIDEHVGSMAKSGEQAIGGLTHGSIGLGETVTWRARHFGIWFTMTSKITALQRSDRFVTNSSAAHSARFITSTCSRRMLKDP